MENPAIAVHGGAGTILRSRLNAQLKLKYLKALQQALDAGYAVLHNKGPAVEAVVEAVKVLEDCELFNAGKGSVFTSKGTHEMDASLMEGSARKAGAVAAVKGIKNPIVLARCVMEKSQHVLLAGEGALEFARAHGFESLPDSWFYTEERYKQWLELKDTEKVELDHGSKELGTVGAVAADVNGNVAAATSTGGMTNKAWGRLGDSAIIGAGTYANNSTCAVSCTGHGEFFMKGLAAYDVSALMEYKGLSLAEAADEVIQNRMRNMGGEGGLIAIDAAGTIGMPFNSEGMYRGKKDPSGTFTAIY